MVVPFKEVDSLHGAVRNTANPEFDAAAWFSGGYQSKFEDFVNDNIGFRTWLVQIHNQFKFSLFDQPNAKGLVYGKEGYLYEHGYISAYNGDDYLGKSEIRKRVSDIKLLEDKLAKKNKTLIVCLAPGKGSFYPEYIPDNMIKPKGRNSDSTNYKQYAHMLSEFDVNHIDVNAWFLEMKDTCDCMLYPKYGIHWSYYGMLRVADSIVKYIEKKRNIQMPKIEIGEIEYSSKLRHSDYDIGNGMNLLFQMKSEPMCYPKRDYISDDNSIKPKTLVVSDSFYWSMFNAGIGGSVFSIGGFWYYNNQIYPDSYDTSILVEEVDFATRVLDNDVIILMSTEATLPKFSWGFVEKANELID